MLFRDGAMKIKIFSGLQCEVEKKINRFIEDKYVVGMHQSICCKENNCNENNNVITISVLYHDHYHNTYCKSYFK